MLNQNAGHPSRFRLSVAAPEEGPRLCLASRAHKSDTSVKVSTPTSGRVRAMFVPLAQPQDPSMGLAIWSVGPRVGNLNPPSRGGAAR